MREYNTIIHSFNDLTKKIEVFAKRFQECEQSNIKYFRESLINGVPTIKSTSAITDSGNGLALSGKVNTSGKIKYSTCK